MFDIVAADQDKLPLTIEIERVHDAETWLSCPAAGHVQPPPEQQAEQGDPDSDDPDQSKKKRGTREKLVVCKKITERLHQAFRLNAPKFTRRRLLARYTVWQPRW